MSPLAIASNPVPPRLWSNNRDILLEESKADEQLWKWSQGRFKERCPWTIQFQKCSSWEFDRFEAILPIRYLQYVPLSSLFSKTSLPGGADEKTPVGTKKEDQEYAIQQYSDTLSNPLTRCWRIHLKISRNRLLMLLVRMLLLSRIVGRIICKLGLLVCLLLYVDFFLFVPSLSVDPSFISLFPLGTASPRLPIRDLARAARGNDADIQVGSCLALIALITGFFRARLFFLVAAVTSGLSALLLMM